MFSFFDLSRTPGSHEHTLFRIAVQRPADSLWQVKRKKAKVTPRPESVIGRSNVPDTIAISSRPYRMASVLMDTIGYKQPRR